MDVSLISESDKTTYINTGSQEIGNLEQSDAVGNVR